MVVATVMGAMAAEVRSDVVSSEIRGLAPFFENVVIFLEGFGRWDVHRTRSSILPTTVVPL